MLKTLIRLKLDMLLAWFTGATRKKEAQSKGKLLGFAALMAMAVGSLGLMFWHIFDTLAQPFHTFGLDWLFFSMVGIMTLAIMLIGSIFTAKAQIYEARDNDLLLSLPVRPGLILLTRMFMLWVINIVIDLLAVVPAAMVWSDAAGFTPFGAVAFVLVFVLLLPLFALALAAGIGWLISLVTTKTKNKTLITMVLSGGFVGAYLYLETQLNILLEKLVAQGDQAAKKLGAIAPVWWIGDAVGNESLRSLLLTALLMGGVFALMYFILARSFVRVTTGQKGGKREKYVEKQHRQQSPERALLKKEFRMFVSSPAYMLNCGMGAIMALIAAGVLVAKREMLRTLLSPELTELLLIPGILLALCFLALMILVSAPAISLEGKRMWLMQSIPVEAKTVLQMKLKVHNTVGLPAMLITSGAAICAMRPGTLMAVDMVALPCVMVLFSGVLGLAENIRHPSFNWVNETQAVKTGMGMLYTMLICIAITAAPGILLLVYGDVLRMDLVFAGLALLLAAATGILYRWLLTRGAEEFAAL